MEIRRPAGCWQTNTHYNVYCAGEILWREPMPELPELDVVSDVLTCRILGQTIVSTESIPPGRPIIVRDLNGEGFAPGLAGKRFEGCPGVPAAT